MKMKPLTIQLSIKKLIKVEIITVLIQGWPSHLIDLYGESVGK
jgi:hypothetical protein